MSKYTPLKLVKTTASIFAAAALVACGGGGSGGGSMQPVGSIKVSEEVEIDDQVSVTFTGCQARGFSAILDGVNVTSLFADTDGVGNSACEKTASVYALQGILGEKAQAGGKSKLVAKATGRSDVSKSFTFKAWPEFAFQPASSGQFTAKVFNALVGSVFEGNAEKYLEGKGLRNVSAEDNIIEADEKNGGLANNFALAGTGKEVEDAWVIKLAETVEGNEVFADWLESYLNAKGHEVSGLAISFIECDQKNSLCLKIDGLDSNEITVVIEEGGAASLELFTASSDGASEGVEEIVDLINALSDALSGKKETKDKKTESVLYTKEITQIEFQQPSTIRVKHKIKPQSVSPTALNYFVTDAATNADVSKPNLGRDQANKVYIAASSSAINQQLLVSALVGKLNIDSRADEDKKPDPIELCESETECLRDDIMPQAVAAIRGVLNETEIDNVPLLGKVNVGALFSDDEVRNLIKAVIPKGATLHYEFDTIREDDTYYNTNYEGSAPYVRYLEGYNEVAISDSQLKLVLLPAIKSENICKESYFVSVLGLSAKQKADECKKMVLPTFEREGSSPVKITEGEYSLIIDGFMVKQRFSTNVSNANELSQLLLHMPAGAETRINNQKPKMVFNEEYDSVPWGQGPLDRKIVLPLIYDLVGPVVQELLGGIGDLDKPTPEIKLECKEEQPDIKDVLDKLFKKEIAEAKKADGTKKEISKHISFMNGEVARDKVHDSSYEGAKEAKHLIMGGQIVQGLNEDRTAGLIITYEPCAEDESGDAED